MENTCSISQKKPAALSGGEAISDVWSILWHTRSSEKQFPGNSQPQNDTKKHEMNKKELSLVSFRVFFRGYNSSDFNFSDSPFLFS